MPMTSSEGNEQIAPPTATEWSGKHIDDSHGTRSSPADIRQYDQLTWAHGYHHACPRTMLGCQVEFHLLRDWGTAVAAIQIGSNAIADTIGAATMSATATTGVIRTNNWGSIPSRTHHHHRSRYHSASHQKDAVETRKKILARDEPGS
jgi:hypothetical protein